MKYKSKSIVVDGIKFPSQLEAKRYIELKMMQRSGRISNLKLQPRFELQPSFKKNGKNYRKIEYVADFQYFDNKDKKVVVEDTKGFETEVFKLKKKMFEYKYPDLELTLIRR